MPKKDLTITPEKTFAHPRVRKRKIGFGIFKHSKPSLAFWHATPLSWPDSKLLVSSLFGGLVWVFGFWFCVFFFQKYGEMNQTPEVLPVFPGLTHQDMQRQKNMSNKTSSAIKITKVRQNSGVAWSFFSYIKATNQPTKTTNLGYPSRTDSLLTKQWFCASLGGFQQISFALEPISQDLKAMLLDSWCLWLLAMASNRAAVPGGRSFLLMAFCWWLWKASEPGNKTYNDQRKTL